MPVEPAIFLQQEGVDERRRHLRQRHPQAVLVVGRPASRAAARRRRTTRRSTADTRSRQRRVRPHARAATSDDRRRHATAFADRLQPLAADHGLTTSSLPPRLKPTMVRLYMPSANAGGTWNTAGVVRPHAIDERAGVLARRRRRGRRDPRARRRGSATSPTCPGTPIGSVRRAALRRCIAGSPAGVLRVGRRLQLEHRLDAARQQIDDGDLRLPIALGRAHAQPDEELLADGDARHRVALRVDELADDLDALTHLRAGRIAIEARFVDGVVRRQRSAPGELHLRRGLRDVDLRHRAGRQRQRALTAVLADLRDPEPSHAPPRLSRRRRAPAACTPPTASSPGCR